MLTTAVPVPDYYWYVCMARKKQSYEALRNNQLKDFISFVCPITVTPAIRVKLSLWSGQLTFVAFISQIPIQFHNMR